MDILFQFIYELPKEELYAFANSQFFSSIVGALAGAFAGAIAAHRIGSNARKREDIELELRSVNLAISAAFLTCNSMLGMKNQHIREMYENFASEKERYVQTMQNPPQGGQPIQFDTDLKTLHMPFVPFDDAIQNIQDRISINGRPLALLSAIANSLNTLRSSLEYRNKLIEEFKTLFPNIRGQETLNYYFGMPLANGSVNHEYSDTLVGIYQYTDDVIYFSSLLCSDLNKYGEELRNFYVKKYRRKIRKITRPDFNTEKAQGLMPSHDNYSDWLTMFQPHDEEGSWFQRIFSPNKASKKDAHERASS